MISNPIMPSVQINNYEAGRGRGHGRGRGQQQQVMGDIHGMVQINIPQPPQQ